MVPKPGMVLPETSQSSVFDTGLIIKKVLRRFFEIRSRRLRQWRGRRFLKGKPWLGKATLAAYMPPRAIKAS